MPNRLDLVKSTEQLIAEGCEPRFTKAPNDLYEAFYDAAFDSLRKGAPGLTDATRSTIARSIALKCERAAKKQDRAA